jgi:hypothetical protein
MVNQLSLGYTGASFVVYNTITNTEQIHERGAAKRHMNLAAIKSDPEAARLYREEWLNKAGAIALDAIGRRHDAFEINAFPSGTQLEYAKRVDLLRNLPPIYNEGALSARLATLAHSELQGLDMVGDLLLDDWHSADALDTEVIETLKQLRRPDDPLCQEFGLTCEKIIHRSDEDANPLWSIVSLNEECDDLGVYLLTRSRRAGRLRVNDTHQEVLLKKRSDFIYVDSLGNGPSRRELLRRMAHGDNLVGASLPPDVLVHNWQSMKSELSVEPQLHAMAATTFQKVLENSMNQHDTRFIPFSANYYAIKL